MVWLSENPTLNKAIADAATKLAAAVDRNTAAIDRNTAAMAQASSAFASAIGGLAAAAEKNTDQIKRLADDIHRAFSRPEPVSNFSVKPIGERSMPHMILFEADWKAVGAGEDVDHLELTIDVDGAQSVKSLDKSLASFGDVNLPAGEGIEAPVGSKLTLSIVKVDAGGNKSEVVSSGPHDVVDTFAPTAVEGFGLKSIGERIDP